MTTAQKTELITLIASGQTDRAIAILRAPAPVKASARSSDPATMTDRELFAYYKRTGLREDVRFFLAHALSDVATIALERVRLEARGLLEALETRPATAADRALYLKLTDRWRHETYTYDQRRIEAA